MPKQDDPRKIDALEAIEENAPEAIENEDLSRRGFLGKISAGALGMVAAISSLTTKSAHATYNVECCTLAHPPNSSCYSACFHISGYTGRSWTCSTGSKTFECYECTAGSSCWQGPWACSAYWQI